MDNISHCCQISVQTTVLASAAQTLPKRPPPAAPRSRYLDSYASTSSEGVSQFEGEEDMEESYVDDEEEDMEEDEDMDVDPPADANCESYCSSDFPNPEAEELVTPTKTAPLIGWVATTFIIKSRHLPRGVCVPMPSALSLGTYHILPIPIFSNLSGVFSHLSSLPRCIFIVLIIFYLAPFSSHLSYSPRDIFITLIISSQPTFHPTYHFLLGIFSLHLSYFPSQLFIALIIFS